MSTEKKQFEPETGDHLVSEVLGIPLLWRPRERKPDFIHHTIFGSIGIPELITDDRPFSRLLDWKPFSKLFHGTIGSRLGIPELVRDRTAPAPARPAAPSLAAAAPQPVSPQVEQASADKPDQGS